MSTSHPQKMAPLAGATATPDPEIFGSSEATAAAIAAATARAAELREAASKAMDRYYRRYGAKLKAAMEDAWASCRKAEAEAARMVAATPKGAEALANVQRARSVWSEVRKEAEAAQAKWQSAVDDATHRGFLPDTDKLAGQLAAIEAATPDYLAKAREEEVAERAFHLAQEAWHAIAGKDLYAHQAETEVAS